MRKYFLPLAAATLLTFLATVVRADMNGRSYSTVPAGTTVANPLWYPANPVPFSQSYSSVAHLAILKAAKMSVTTDQAMTAFLWRMPTSYSITSIYAANCTTTPEGAVGGIYPVASKGGTPIVAASQTYAALATTTAIQPLTNNVPLLAQSELTFFFSLTTAATTGTPTCDLYIDGIGLQ